MRSSRRYSTASFVCAVVACALAGCAGSASSVASGASPASVGRALPETSIVAAAPHKTVKRGIAYDIASAADLAALAPGISWYYNWSTTPNPALPEQAAARRGVEFIPMLWDGNFDADTVVAFYRAHPNERFLLVLNEPNVAGQAYLSPSDAALLWPRYEAVASRAGVKIVGPAITWGTMPGYEDPVAWLDAFYAAYRSAHPNHDPRIDYLAFHWYDYGLSGQLDRLAKYHKPYWVTEFANWHSQPDGAQIDTLQGQETQMAAMVAVCENRPDVFRYAWFTGRVSPDPHFDSVLATPATLTPLGSEYVSL